MQHRHAARLALLALGGIITGAGAPVRSGTEPPSTTGAVRLEVDLSERTLYVYHGGELMNTFAVTVGEPEHPTPTGEFSIARIIWNPAWVPPDVEWAEGESRKSPGDADNPMQGAKLFFKYPDYYIHGTNAPRTVGTAASHGCVRMREADVLSLARFVQEHGGEARSDAWYNEASRDDRSKHEVSLADPVPVAIRD